MVISDPLSHLDIIRNLGQRFKEYRLRMELTQKEVAERAALSIPTIYKFETGNLTDISMLTFLKLMRVIELEGNWANLIPLLPDSPYMYKENKRKKRVRHK